MAKESRLKYLTNGIIKENPNLVLVLGTCPTLATTSSIINGLGMGLSTAAVLICSNIVISAIRKIVPDKVRIPCYIVVIAGFVTVVQMIMQAYTPALYSALGLYIPLIVVNCIILGRAEMFANKHNVIDSALDGIGMGLGFTLTLCIMGAIRELIGSGTLLNFRVIPASIPGMNILNLASGGFFVFGCVMAAVHYFSKDKSKIRDNVGEADLFREAQDLKKKEA